MNPSLKLTATLFAAVLLTAGGCGEKTPEPPKTELPAAAAAAVVDAKIKEAKEIAQAAYIYGYSLITTEVTRMQMSNVPKAEGLRAPTGQFLNVPRYPPADYRGVSAPNADTLYSLAWVDLSDLKSSATPTWGSAFIYLRWSIYG